MSHISVFHCVVCGDKLTWKRVAACRQQGLPGCCYDHARAVRMDLAEHLPSWNDHFFGGWSKSITDEFWYCDAIGKYNDGSLYADLEQASIHE